jgi:hypothetical protein
METRDFDIPKQLTETICVSCGADNKVDCSNIVDGIVCWTCWSCGEIFIWTDVNVYEM